MDAVDLSAALATLMPKTLASDLTDEFIQIRVDIATGTLGRAAPGKFVETVVQVLQALEASGKYDKHPKVDQYLLGLDSRASTLPDGLRICAARLARAMYALRSKRSIVHKSELQPSLYDLHLLYAGSQWILAELLALTPGISGVEAARLVAEVQLPAGGLVEAIDGRRIVHADLSVRDEVLILLMGSHPTPVGTTDLLRSMDRRAPSSVRNAVSALWSKKLVHRTDARQVVLTEAGLREAVGVARNHAR